MNELVSICITVYNREDTLKKCLDSIINQTYKNIEILILDDKSTDGSLLTIERYRLKDKRITILKNDQNYGPVKSTEKLYNIASGKYLCSVDSDDYIHLDCIKKCMNNINDKGLIYTYCKHFGDCTKLDNRALYPYSKDSLLDFFMVFHFRLFKTIYWHQIKKFEVKRFCYDYELVIKLSELCEFKILPEVLYYWRIHTKQMTSKNNIKLIKEEMLFIKKQALIRRNRINNNLSSNST